MKVAVVSLWKKLIERELKKAGFDVASRKPEAVVCVGGEGTFLFAELEHPGVPKLLLMHHCSGCNGHDYHDMLEKLKAGKYRIEEKAKISGISRGRKLVALNDISVHFSPPCAIGIDVSVDGKVMARNLVGDGVVVATPYGSSAYYHSITRKAFRNGIGIAFNNPAVATGHVVVPDTSVIEVRVTKGEGYMAADCNRNVLPLKKGDTVEIRKWPEPARIIVLKGHELKPEM
jgi:NAD+ kinase